MNRPDPDLPNFRRAIAFFICLLHLTTVGVFWLVPSLAPGCPLSVLALLDAVLVFILCLPVLSYTLSRWVGAFNRAEEQRSRQIVRQTAEGILTI